MSEKILALVSVGDKYTSSALNVVNRFSELGWRIHILTDNPQVFENCTVETFSNSIFSYFDKMLFVLKCIKTCNNGVLYIDVDRVDEYSIELLNKLTTFKDTTILNYWPESKEFKGIYSKGKHFTPFIHFCELENLDYDIDTFSEEIFFVPFLDKIDRVIHDVEKLKPVFEYQSLISRDTNMYYPNIGNAEGLALSYALKNNGYKLLKYEH